MKMFGQIIDGAGAANLIVFLGGSTAQITKVVEFAEAWSTIMFAVSGTAAAVYGVLKIITWCKNNKKNKE
jgi:hypothetical protein